MARGSQAKTRLMTVTVEVRILVLINVTGCSGKTVLDKEK